MNLSMNDNNLSIQELYQQVLNEHNLDPKHRKDVNGYTYSQNGVNPSCGDRVTLQIRMSPEGDIIEEVGFSGNGCAVSQASADMMIDVVTGKTREEALNLAGIFSRMIRGEADITEIELLGEASTMKCISSMPSRVKCAMLSWNTLRRALS